MKNFRIVFLLPALILADSCFAMFPVCGSIFGPILPRSGSDLEAERVSEAAKKQFQDKQANFLGTDGKRVTGLITHVTHPHDPYAKDPTFTVHVKLPDGTSKEMTLSHSEMVRLTKVGRRR